LLIEGSASGSSIDHVVLDGNRGGRTGSSAWTACLTGADNRGTAINARNTGATGVSFTKSASINALCASGFEWIGDQCSIRSSYFASNGNHADGRWSDGLTLLQCRNGVVSDSVFHDNTDVNLIIGCGVNLRVQRNTITQASASSFAGLMLDNFDSSTCGNYTGGLVEDTSIDCASQQCDFGAEFGPHAWYASSNIIGGTVSSLTVVGAKQGVNVAGAGVAGNPLTLTAVSVGPCPSSAHFNCGEHQTSAFNVAPGSVVLLSGTPPATSFAWNACP
jgi:hypothetical protein